MSQTQIGLGGTWTKWGASGVLAFALLCGSYLGAYAVTATQTLEPMDCMPHRTYQLGSSRLPPWCDRFFFPADWLHEQLANHLSRR
jgi:hypothetical protein